MPIETYPKPKKEEITPKAENPKIEEQRKFLEQTYQNSPDSESVIFREPKVGQPQPNSFVIEKTRPVQFFNSVISPTSEVAGSINNTEPKKDGFIPTASFEQSLGQKETKRESQPIVAEGIPAELALDFNREQQILIDEVAQDIKPENLNNPAQVQEVVQNAEDEIKKNPSKWKQLLSAGWTTAKIATAVALGAVAVAGTIVSAGLVTTGAIGGAVMGGRSGKDFQRFSNNLAGSIFTGSVAAGAVGFGVGKSAFNDIKKGIESRKTQQDQGLESQQQLKENSKVDSEFKSSNLDRRFETQEQSESQRVNPSSQELENLSLIQKLQRENGTLRQKNDSLYNEFTLLRDEFLELKSKMDELKNSKAENRVEETDIVERGQNKERTEAESETENNTENTQNQEEKETTNQEREQEQSKDIPVNFKNTKSFEDTTKEAVIKKSGAVKDEELGRVFRESEFVIGQIPELSNPKISNGFEKVEMILTLGKMMDENKIEEGSLVGLSEQMKDEPKYKAITAEIQSSDPKIQTLLEEGLPIYLALIERQEAVDRVQELKNSWGSGGKSEEWQSAEAVLQSLAGNNDKVGQWVKENMEPELSQWGVGVDYKNATGRDLNLNQVLEDIKNNAGDCPALIRQQLGKIMAKKLEVEMPNSSSI
jgi:hypothetical protein